MKFIEENVGTISKMDEEKIIQDVLENNIYVIAKTPMAKTITQRTLAGYKNWKTNISYIPDIVNEIKDDLDKTIEKVQNAFGGKIMKFDVVVGNPPYQEEILNREEQPPIYHYFYDLASKVSESYCLISPARFLFNAGKTPKGWNKKMLNDKHLKVVYYEQKSDKIFPNTDIKGGVAILYHDIKKIIGPIKNFTSHTELNGIVEKVVDEKHISIGDIMYSSTSYKYSGILWKENSNLIERVSGGSKRYLSSSVFDKMHEVFYDEMPNNKKEYIRILGRQNNERIYKWFRRDYLMAHPNMDKFKVCIPSSNGTGAIGEVLSTPLIGTPLIGTPLIGFTETFISIGAFDNELEAENCLKYLKGKFARTMLGIKKVTQNNKTKETWSKVPLQDFTENSDIDWTQSIADIDKQLYKKYNLDENEINFIEEKVRAME